MIEVTDGKSTVVRTFDVISSQLINIESVQKRYEIGDDVKFVGTAIPNSQLSVIVEDSINVRNDHEVSGFCFTPQDGNSILSSIAATVRFLNPHSYQDKINSLCGFFFDRVLWLIT